LADVEDQFDRPKRFHVHIVEGPYPVDGTWTFEPSGGGTLVGFTAAGELSGPMRLLEPIFKRVMARQFAAYHRNLRRNVTSAYLAMAGSDLRI